MRYEHPNSGQWVQPVKRGYKLACCDCGLVHHMDFRVQNGRAQFRAFRADRLTKKLREREMRLAKRYCNFCGKPFTRSDFLKFTRHQREVHGLDRHKSRHNWKLWRKVAAGAHTREERRDEQS